MTGTRLLRRPAWAGRVARWRWDPVLLPAVWGLEMAYYGGHADLSGRGRAPGWFVPGCTVVLFVLLWWRRRFPEVAFGAYVGWAIGTALVTPKYDAFAGVLLGLYTIAERRRPARSIVALLIGVIPFGIQLHRGHPPVTTWLSALVLPVMIAVGAWALGYRSWLAEAHRKAATERALRDERLRIARELHDIVAHSVSVMVLQAGGAQAVFATDPARAEQALQVIQDVGGQAMSELRRLLGLLRSAAGDAVAEVERQPDLDDLPALLDHARGAGRTVLTETDGSPGRLDPSVGLTAYRVVQEALTNSLKHAGADAWVRVRLAWSPDDLTVTVADQGRGSEASAATMGLSTGHGLRGLAERVSTVGGLFDARPSAEGFVVTAVLPVAHPSAVRSTGRIPQPTD